MRAHSPDPKLAGLLMALTLLSLPGGITAQVPWHQYAVPPGPSIRERPAGASDGHVFYLSGGNDGTAAANIQGDLWSFDGAVWTLINGTGAGFAPNRTGHAMVWDEARGRLVVFGGVTAPWPTRLGDTWEWDPVGGWVDVTPPVSPTPRSFMAFAYVPGVGMVIHGGQLAATPHADDTWAWDGASWTLLGSGPERNVSAMVYRPPPDHDLILFGGSASPTGSTRLDETWRFDLTTNAWAIVPTATTPPGAVGMAMFHDAVSGEVIMHGGNAATSPASDTWAFDGSDWSLATPVPAGPSRRNMAADFVTSWGRGVVACGHDGVIRMADIWERVGTGCIISTPASPTRGDITIDVEVASPFSASTDLTFEYSTDGGLSFLLCQPAAASALANPAPGSPIGMSTFLWDSAADTVGSPVPQAGVLVRASVFDSGAPAPGTAGCQTRPFEIDNTPFCPVTCGDCNENGTGPDILDALTAAQIAVGVILPTAGQIGCCDVNASLVIDIIDALGIAQSAAGLPATISCP